MDLRSARKTIEILGVLLAASACAGEAFIISAGGAVYWAEQGHDKPPTLTIYGQVFI